jgi:GTP-binding protein
VRIEAAFVTSAADSGGFPRDGLPQVPVVGRSNVGKSTLINALARARIARTSAAPGKTRLANFYRVRRGGAPPFHLVDLPGYGYARGGAASRASFDALTRAYFIEAAPIAGAILAIDIRHPGLDPDVEASQWLASLGGLSRRNEMAAEVVIRVATKADKLSRAERTSAIQKLEHVLQCPVLPVSAVTGEGMEDLWKHLVRLLSLPRPPQPPPSSSSRRSRT